jgi:tetratricopeptide (TPR) repeat protein
MREARQAAHMTQEQLAAVWPKSGGTEQGVNIRYVQDVEYGHKHIEDPQVLRKLAAILDIPLWKFGLSEYDPFNPQNVSGCGTSTAPDSCIATIERQLEEQSERAITSDQRLAPRGYSMEEEPPLVTSEGEDADMDRYDFLHGTVPIAAVSILTSDDILLSELAERFKRAVKRPSTLDEGLFTLLEKRSENYWQEHYSASCASQDLFSYVKEHFQKVTALLEGSLLPIERMRLCCIASGATLLVGALLFDMKSYVHAREFFKNAILAAQEANHSTLQAIGWGWRSLTWTYDGDIRAAYSCIQAARHLASQNASTTVRAWLAAVEAEIQAELGNLDLCLKALDEATAIEEQQPLKEDWYLTYFDRCLLAGYKGVCFRRLHRPADAHRALKEALNLLDPATTLRQPMLLADLAGTYVQQGEIEEACRQAIQAVTMLAQNKSSTQTQRLLTVRQELEPWKDTQYVQGLDKHLVPLLSSGWYRRKM